MIREKYGNYTGTKYKLFNFQWFITLVKCHKNMQKDLPIFTHKSDGYSTLKPVFHHLKKTVRGLYESITYTYKREQIWTKW